MSLLLEAGISAVGSVFDEIFGSVDQGHWEGTTFVPGDRNTRQDFLMEQMSLRGLTQMDLSNQDLTYIQRAVTIPNGWQGQVTSYLDQVAENKRLGVGQVLNNAVGGVESLIGSASDTMVSNAGFGSLDLTTIIIFGLIITFLFRK